MIFSNLFKIYFGYFNFIAKPRIEKQDIDLRRVHTHNLTVVLTSVLMWSYAIIAFVFMSNSRPGIIGLTCAILHALSPLLFRTTNNILIVSSFMLLAGVIHQSSFAYYTGGYSSSILIWFGIIPMLSGIIAGKKGIAIWSGIVSLVAATFLYFQLKGFSFPNIISPTGLLLSHTLLIFGWIAVASSVLYLFNILIDNHEVRLKEKTDKIDNLLKILLHDMSNSIHVLSGTLGYIKSHEDDETTGSSKFRVLKKHVTFLSDMISSIKSMYVMNSQTDSLPLREVTLNRSISLITSIIDNKLKAKNIKINYDFEKNQHSYILASPHIFENQILQNILTNAIKFSNPNGVIDISTSTSIIDNNLLDIKIRDYGVGMSSETQENLFNPQKRTSLPGTSNEQGTGLGMLIIKNFMEKMKGNVKVTSAAGEGTEVTITFEKA